MSDSDASGTQDPTPELGYYVSTLRVRRELIPVHEGEGDNKKLVAYRCLTYPVDGPADGDKVMADQVEFEDELIRLRLMAPRDPITAIYAWGWRALGVDKWKVGNRPAGSDPTETLLRIINN